MELRKREELAFRFDQQRFPNGLRIDNPSGEPSVISLHGENVSRFTINGVQAQENALYSLDQGLEILGPGQVGIHIRPGHGTTPEEPAGNG